MQSAGCCSETNTSCAYSYNGGQDRRGECARSEQTWNRVWAYVQYDELPGAGCQNWEQGEAYDETDGGDKVETAEEQQAVPSAH